VNIFRKILFPFSLIYNAITSIRNGAYDKGILPSRSFDFPIIVVGNLNVGGTGKSPHIEYLIRLLNKKYKIAVLSRGYKRKSKGYQLADENSTAAQLGDEPFQFYRKFKDILVAVDTNRVNGIISLRRLNDPPEIILLDDAFQHRSVKAGLFILLTSFDDLYVDDLVLPSGTLRENRKGARRADIIIVTKCPLNISKEDRLKISKKLKLKKHQLIFFSTIVYSESLIGVNGELSVSKLNEFKVLLVTGIANSKPLEQYLESLNIDFLHLKYRDHYSFSKLDKEKINRKFEGMKGNKKIILTTEKDYVRAFSNGNEHFYYLTILSKILDEEAFNEEILNYVR
jgi:tetraacyldisaccharide 4'-kinase